VKILLARFVAAIRFLTIFPIPGQLGHNSSELAGSIPFFPVVGLLLGTIAAFCSWWLWLFLPPAVAAVVLTLILLGFSGGLHLDGLADTADGFFSARPRAQILEIMRDSRIGAMGVIGLILVILLKVTALAGLSRAQALQAALLMPIAGRCAIVVFMALLPYARPEGGLGTLFYTRRSKIAGVAAVVFLSFFVLLTVGMNGWAAVLLFLILLVSFALFCTRVIGGATGDTLGAACEMSEACMALALSALFWS
jgi:adenosylcobinamide-GDP ribazoletransferase